jgi:putative membrane-bound dehydrogenase-like protein
MSQNRIHDTPTRRLCGCRFCFAVLLAFSALPMLALMGQEADFANELPRIPPTHPQDALATFQLAEGFQIELAACEPNVASPVAMEWDATGKLFVCEMRGYSEDRDDELSRIRCLEDTNGDGVYEKSTIYAEGLLWPTALFPYDGGLFVGDAPNLYWFRDQDGDGVADERKTVLTGFGTTNVQGLMNSFRWGLDNRIHIACSSVGGTVKPPNETSHDQAGKHSPPKGINVRGRDLAFDPQTGEFELTSGAAQHGMCFDDWGRKFVSSNSNHIQQVMYEDHYLARNPFVKAPPSRISIAADGPQAEVFRTSPVEPWRIVRTRLRVGGLVPGPVEGGGRAAGYFTGATGITIYRGDAWPKQWSGLAVIGDVGSNLIHRKRLEPNGVEFVARRIDPGSEFVTSSDIWFRPAQFANGPDGNLYVIDVCREVIEHPKSLPPAIKRHLDLTAGRDRGRIYRIVSTESERAPPVSHPRNLRELDSTELAELLDHSNAWQRETASRLIFERQDIGLVPRLAALASNAKIAQGRVHSLYALHGLNALDESTVLNCLRDDHPQVRRHAVRLGESYAESPEIFAAIHKLSRDPSQDVRLQVAFSLGEFGFPKRIDALAQLIIGDAENRWMQAAVQSSSEKDAGRLFARLVANSEFRSEGAGKFLQNLATQIGQQQSADDLRVAINSIAQLTGADASFSLPILGALLAQRGNGLLADLDSKGTLQVIDTLITQQLEGASQKSLDDSLSLPTRLRAIDSLVYGQMESVEPVLVSLIDNHQPHEVTARAITVLGQLRSPRIASALVETWAGLSPRLRVTATEVLFARPERTLALFDAIDKDRISLADLGTPRLKMAAESKNSEISKRASKFLSEMGTQDRAQIFSKYQATLSLGGDVDNGRNLFRKHCSTCHKVEGFGHELGPSLASIKTRGAETILVNVLDPNREVNPQYLNYVVLTKDGRAMTGMISAESATSVTLQRAEGATDTVLRVDIDQLKSTGLSIMPEGLEENLSPQGLADVIAYLMQTD